MKPVLLLLVAVVLLIGRARSLRCYSCLASMNDRDCMDIEECSPAHKVCLTAVADIFDMRVVTKLCAPSCDLPDADVRPANASETCCEEDLCNDLSIGDYYDSGTSSAKLSSLVGALSAVAFIGSLLKLGL